MNYFSQEMTFTKGEVAGVAVALMLLGLYGLHHEKRRQQQACDMGYKFGFTAGGQYAMSQSAHATQQPQPQDTRSTAQQLFAAPPSAGAIELSPQGYGRPYG